MPGVLMLEAMTQAGAWLVRFSEDFAHSIVVLKQAHVIDRHNTLVIEIGCDARLANESRTE